LRHTDRAILERLAADHDIASHRLGDVLVHIYNGLGHVLEPVQLPAAAQPAAAEQRAVVAANALYGKKALVWTRRAFSYCVGSRPTAPA
jgi:hypothetical protein